MEKLTERQLFLLGHCIYMKFISVNSEAEGLELVELAEEIQSPRAEEMRTDHNNHEYKYL